ncbi:Protein PHLOEM PROTEIN 2-LIKE A9 [Forsythia ovata]|uniref:Protein PHLOEM PROTEIN 2-LIKE A9 n=1 Tax=Forsythia ovata TaxID=205694 RepID=A0ABD1S032_9LAMI
MSTSCPCAGRARNLPRTSRDVVFIIDAFGKNLNVVPLQNCVNIHSYTDALDNSKEGQLIILPRDLSIVWGGDNRYWNIQPDDKPAELLQVCWLEVTGSVNGIDPKKSYTVSFTISFTPDAFGWGEYPLYFMVKTGKEENSVWKKVVISSTNANEKMEISGDSNTVKESSDSNSKLYFGLYEVWSGKWKGGMQIHQVVVREANKN